MQYGRGLKVSRVFTKANPPKVGYQIIQATEDDLFYAISSDSSDVLLGGSDGGSTITKVGEVTFGDMNAAAAAAKIDFTFAAAKAADKVLINVFGEITQAFLSSTAVDILGYTNKTVFPVTPDFKVLGLKIRTGRLGGVDGATIKEIQNINVAEDLVLQFLLSAVNAQDWTTGKFQVFIETAKIPTLPTA
ncbi:hypothetical protein JYU20_00490 [Bacteroidales bacterium AH-315-I05]|nr:hypothetical protein [Bacteroidales bacterium AH-315-I05]